MEGMERKNNRFIKTIISSILIFTFIFSMVLQNINVIKPIAAGGNLIWNQNKVLNYQGNEVDSSDNNMMIEFPMKLEGNYILTFFTPDSYAYTLAGDPLNSNGQVVKHVIKVTKERSRLTEHMDEPQIVYDHKIYIWDDFTSDFTTDITSVYASSLLEWDFNAQPQASFFAKDAATEIKYTVYQSDTWGKIYKLSGQTFNFKWTTTRDVTTGLDVDTLKLTFEDLAGIRNGTIYPFSLSPQGEPLEKLEILKSVQMTSESKRWVITDDSANPPKFSDDRTLVMEMKKTDNTKVRPGFQLNITRPLKYSEVDKKFIFISDTDARNMQLTLNFESKIEQITGINLDQLEKVGTDNIYRLNIIGYGSTVDNTLHSQVLRLGDSSQRTIKYVLRGGLKDSNVYNTELIIQTTQMQVKTKVRSYTYMDFAVLRRSIDETYIELEPYEYPGSYEIYVLNAKSLSDASFFSSNENKWAEHFTKDESNIPEKVYIPVYMTRKTDASENWYTVGVRFKETGGAYEGSYVNSETLYYDANADRDITIDVPYLEAPSNIIVVNGENQTKAASFDLSWELPVGLFDGEGRYRILNNADEKLWYEVAINTTETNKPDNEYQIVDVLMLKRNTDGTVTITNKNGTVTKTLTQDDKHFNMKIELKNVNNNKWAEYLEPTWRGVNDALNRPINEVANINKIGKYTEGLDQDRTYKNSFFNPAVEKVPGNYFITMRAFYDPVGSDEKLTISDYALPVNVYLKEIKEYIEVPSKVIISNVEKSQFDASINDVSIDKYLEKMLDPINAVVKDNKPRYQVFISKDESVLLNLIDGTEISEMKEVGDIPGVHKYIGEQNIADADASGKIKIDIGTTSGTSVEEFRNNIVYSFITDGTKLQVLSLDKNESYYVAVRTVLDIMEGTDNYKRYSEISTIYFTRTTTDIVVPDSNEKMPPTPVKFRKDESPTDKKVVIRWEEPDLVEEAGYQYGYEIIRVADNNLQELERANERTILNISNSGYKGFKAYRVIDDTLYVFDDVTKTWTTNVGNDSYEHVILPDYMKINDVGVNPNRLYYYYIRTMKFKETATGLVDDTNSEWSELTATTTPITGVNNLKEEITPKKFNITDLNEFYEAMFSFEAPIGNAVLGTSNPKLPDAIDFKIQTKLVLDTIYEDPISVKLVAITAKDSVTATYVYRISKLESGSKYNIKVAMIDKSSTDANGNFAMSSYCEPIAIRTEFSQEDYDRKEKYKDYEKYYEVLLNKIVNDVKYVIEDSKDLYAVKYKEDKFLGELGKLSEGTYLLETKDEVNDYEYYISQACIEEMKRLKKGLRIVKDNTSIILPYRFIDREYTEEYVEMLDTIKDKNDVIDDFYVKISVSFGKAPEYIGTKKTLSPVGKVELSIVELESLNAEIDYAIESEVLAKIANEKDDFLDELYIKLKGKIDDEKYLELIEEKKNQLIDVLAEKINSKLDQFEDDEFAIRSLYSPINIKIENINSDAKILSRAQAASWKQLNTNSSLGMLSAYMYDLGSFVLAREYDMTITYGNELTRNAENIKEKYQLHNIFIQNATLDQKNGTVSIALFRNIAFTILTIDNSNIYEKANIMKQVNNEFQFDYDPITRQEAIYGLMQLYNKFSATDINKLNVKNGDAIADIKGVSNYVKQSILAALELGLISHDDVVGPNERITPEKFLDLIYKIIG